jgi:hypothetical protein
MERVERLLKKHWRTAGMMATATVGLYLTSRSSYLLFHSLAEILSVVVVFSVFLVTWSSRRYIENGYLLFVGAAAPALGTLDLIHTLAYQGMPTFPGFDFAGNQLWIAARYLESLTLLAGFSALSARRRPRPLLVLVASGLVTALVLASIFAWRVFPACFVAGQGQTRFKILSEYVVMGILAVDAGLLVANRARFDRGVYGALLGSILLAICTEAAFTVYVSNYGPANMVGHFLKLASYSLIYLAIVQTAVERPFALVFRELASTNEALAAEVASRRATERDRERVILELRTALDEISTLRGIIPICAHCKNIRDDEGSWSQVEAYVRRHAHVEFSHGICPTCLGRHFPEET